MLIERRRLRRTRRARGASPALLGAAARLRRRPSPLHRRAWAGMAPPARLEALADLPLIDKEMLRASQRAHPAVRRLPRRRAATGVARVHRTSGTTGTAMNLALSAAGCARNRGGRRARARGRRPRAGPPRRALPELPAVDGRLHRPHHAGGHRRDGGAVRRRRDRAAGAHHPRARHHRDLLHALLPGGAGARAGRAFPGLRPRDLGLRLGLFGGEAGLDDPELPAPHRSHLGHARRATPTTASPTCSAILPARPSSTPTCISSRWMCCTPN